MESIIDIGTGVIEEVLRKYFSLVLLKLMDDRFYEQCRHKMRKEVGTNPSDRVSAVVDWR